MASPCTGDTPSPLHAFVLLSVYACVLMHSLSLSQSRQRTFLKISLSIALAKTLSYLMPQPHLT